MTNIDDVVTEWREYLRTVDDWQKLISGVTAKATDCGPVYEIPNPIERPNESFAIADMRELKQTGAHMHINGETEIYIVIEGTGTVTVGEQHFPVEQGTAVVTPPETVHSTQSEGLVVAVINTPPFEPLNVVPA
jgi:mannose-6-phosphate isomerase-like protein (cupin superfamily)